VAVDVKRAGDAPQGHSRRLQRRTTLTAYGFLLPNLLGFLIFTFFPVLAALLISFSHWDLLRPPEWAGLANYQRLVEDTTFHRVLRNTFVYVLGTVPAQMVLALLVAMALNQRIPGRLFFRAAYFMPVVASTVAVALVWRWIFHADFGLLNSALYMIGVDDPPNWLQSTRWALPAIIIMSIWQQIGFSMVLFLAGLQAVPPHLYEAAKIDGASSWHRFVHITIPMLSSTTFFVLVISIINSFQVFDQAFIMTEGGPANATNTLGVQHLPLRLPVLPDGLRVRHGLGAVRHHLRGDRGPVPLPAAVGAL
jgi:multiple sugar transport system permease protein